MKWLLVGFGVLMIGVGGSCVISGYPIVEVERGWALVISGATVLSGGAIVFALGLVLARIEDVSRALTFGMRAQTGALVGAAISVSQPQTVQAPAAQAPAVQDFATQDLGAQDFAAQGFGAQGFAAQGFGAQASPGPHEPNAANEQPHPEPRQEEFPATNEVPESVASPVRIREWKAPAFLRRQPPSEPALEETAAVLAALDRPTLSEAHGQEQRGGPDFAIEERAPSAPEPALQDGAASPIEPPAALEPSPSLSSSDAAGPAEPQREPTSRFRRFPLRSLTLPRGPWPEAPVTRPAAVEQSPHEERAPEPEETAANKPTAEDWFERALAGLDEAPNVGMQDAKAAEHTDSTGESSRPPAASKAAPAEQGEAAAPPESETAEMIAPLDSPTVVGRYETEGTIYVMYSDGSIDAETGTGVYRFESLAALKAHIERPA